MSLQRQSHGFREHKKAMETEMLPSTPILSSPSAIPSPPPPPPPPPAIPSAPADSPSTLPTAQEMDNKESPLEQPNKRRRIIPTFLGTAQESRATSRMPGFEDPDQEEDNAPTAYLGSKAIPRTSLFSLDAELDSDSGPDEFQSVATRARPRGQTKAIYSVVKKFLLSSDRTITAARDIKADTKFPDKDDEIVDWDDLSSLDEETLREIADEEAEGAQSYSSVLDPEAVEGIVSEEISRFISEWQEKKLPKYEKRAFQLWTRARKQGLLRVQTRDAHQQTRHYLSRLNKLTKDLQSLPWKAEDELRFQTQCLEQTVNDKLYQEWLMNLFSQRIAPPKPPPSSTQGQQRSAPPRKRFVHNDELLSSSEEEQDLREFIVSDEEGELALAASPGHLPTLRLPAANADSPTALTTTESRNSPSATTIHPGSQADSVIDLTMHSDAEMADNDEKGTRAELVPDALEPFTHKVLEEIGTVSPKVWSKQKDRFRLVIAMLWKLSFKRREAVFKVLATPDVDDIWSELVAEAFDRLDSVTDKYPISGTSDLTLVYSSFVKCRYYKEQKLSNMSEKDLEKLEDSSKSFPPFCSFVQSVQEVFPKENQIARTDAYDDELLEEDELEQHANSASSKKKKRKEIVMDKGAVALRERETKRMEMQAERRKQLRANMLLDEDGPVSSDSARLIINESKDANQGFIYVNRHIASKIKDHQIAGVRFMWNHIVRDQNERQGCLLAHTMGLGKTMQTITFLVALREAAKSKDPSIRSQIPKDLRSWRILVLCPSGLVENWKDEFLLWAPQDLMERLITIEATQSPPERIKNAKAWSRGGGVLILGYNMFKSEFGKGDESTPTIDKILVNEATLVVADEAHTLKNPNSKIGRLALQMKTVTRIALTGSPLANNVEEYYAMIDWVAPNFLGPRQEFRDLFATPIHQGLYNDSTPYDKRKAIKLLQVLKETAAPKVHRATIKSCLKDDLPPKEEFVIALPLTTMQRRLYDLYISAVDDGKSKINQAGLFAVLDQLALICAHPMAYRKKVTQLKALSAMGRDIPKFPVDTIPRILKITNENVSLPNLSYKVELLVKILDQSRRAGDKVLVFSQSLLTLDYLAELFKHQRRLFCRLDGSTQISKRQDMTKKFNTGDEELYLISTTAGGVGLNIHGANRVVIFDFKWNPVQEQQAIGRAYRIGQKKPVFVYRFVSAGTFEDDLQNKAVFKMQLASRVVDQKNPVSWSKRLQRMIHPVKDVAATSARFDFKGKDAILDHLLDHDDATAILSVMSSDAFEEEDETAALTAEEIQETQGMLQMHHLRLADPAKYSRVVELERLANPGRSAPNTAPSKPSKPNKDWYPERPRHAFRPVPPAQVLSSQSPATVLRSNAAAPDGTQPPPNAAPMAVTTMPAMGANTYVGNSPATLPNPPTLPSNGAPAFGEDSCGAARRKFQDRLVASLRPIEARYANTRFNADATSVSLTAAIDAARKAGGKSFAHDTLRWSSLESKLTNQKFVLAVASGQLSAAYLGGAEEGDLQNRLRMLENLPDEFLLNSIRNGGKEKDPEVRRDTQQE